MSNQLLNYLSESMTMLGRGEVQSGKTEHNRGSLPSGRLSSFVGVGVEGGRNQEQTLL